jgi:hypothetical protein
MSIALVSSSFLDEQAVRIRGRSLSWEVLILQNIISCSLILTSTVELSTSRPNLYRGPFPFKEDRQTAYETGELDLNGRRPSVRVPLHEYSEEIGED